MKLVCEADKFWSLRTRVYTLWRNAKAVKWARHAFSMADEDFVKWVETCAASGNVIPLTTNKPHIVTLKEAVQKGKRLGAQETRETKPKMSWNGKRMETSRISPFQPWILYPPQPVVPEIMRRRGRPKKQAQNN